MGVEATLACTLALGFASIPARIQGRAPLWTPNGHWVQSAPWQPPPEVEASTPQGPFPSPP